MSAEQERDVIAGQMAAEAQSRENAWRTLHEDELSHLKAEHAAELAAASALAGAQLEALKDESVAQQHAVQSEAAGRESHWQKVSTVSSPAVCL